MDSLHCVGKVSVVQMRLNTNNSVASDSSERARNIMFVIPSGPGAVSLVHARAAFSSAMENGLL